MRRKLLGIALVVASSLPLTALAQTPVDDEEEVQSFVSSVGEFVYGLAWPTAEYLGVSPVRVDRVSNGMDVSVTLNGTSSLGGGELWVEVVLEIRDGRLRDLRWGRHNAIVQRPGATVEALGDVLVELSRAYAESTASSGRASGGDEWAVRPQVGQFYARNSCVDPVQLAVWFRDTSSSWDVRGWWQLEPGQSYYLSSDGSRISSRTTTFFLYAESTNGTGRTWAGDQEGTLGDRTLQMKRLEDDEGAYEVYVTCQ